MFGWWDRGRVVGALVLLSTWVVLVQVLTRN